VLAFSRPCAQRFLEYAATPFSSSETPIPLGKALVTVMDSLFGGYLTAGEPVAATELE
jgi:hypothetical protein